MADETENSEQLTGNGQDGGNKPTSIPYDRFKEVNDRLAEARAELEKLTKAQKERAEKELADQNKWKELATQREAELAKERLGRLRLEVAIEKRLPVELADRLRGATAEELAADADGLAALLQSSAPAPAPGTPPRSGQQPPASFTAEQLRDPDFVRKNKAAILSGLK